MNKLLWLIATVLIFFGPIVGVYLGIHPGILPFLGIICGLAAIVARRAAMALPQHSRAVATGGTTMTRAKFIMTLAALAIIAGTSRGAWSQETLKVAIPQRGAWDAGVAELGQRGGIFKKHGLNLEIVYVQAGPESIQAVIGGSMDIATAAGVSAAVGTLAKGAGSSFPRR